MPLLRPHWNRRLFYGCLLYWRRRPDGRRSAIGRSKGRSGRVVCDGPVERVSLWEQSYRLPYPGLGPNQQNYYQQMPEHRLQERRPWGAGGDENVVPERRGSRRDTDLRDSPRQEQVRQVVEEHTMSGFPFDQQPEARYGPGARNVLVRDQNPRGFVHEYTLGGREKPTRL